MYTNDLIEYVEINQSFMTIEEMAFERKISSTVIRNLCATRHFNPIKKGDRHRKYITANYKERTLDELASGLKISQKTVRRYFRELGITPTKRENVFS